MQKTALFTYSQNPYPQRVTATICQHPFGMLMPGRTYTSEAYSWGFNGKEKDDAISGSGNNLDFGARIYDSRLGRWMSVDLIDNTSLSGYVFGSSNPVVFIDSDGNDEYIFHLDGTTTYVPKSNWYNLFHKHIVKIEQPNGGFIIANMQDQKTDHLRYGDPNYSEGENSINYGAKNLYNPQYYSMVNERDVLDGISGKYNSALNTNEKTINYRNYDAERDGNVVDWMSEQNFDYGNLVFSNDRIYIIQNDKGKYIAYNTQNFGNFMYGALAQRLGMSVGQMQLLGHMWNLVKDGVFDTRDDQNAIWNGHDYATSKYGNSSKMVNIFKGGIKTFKNQKEKLKGKKSDDEKTDRDKDL